MDKTTALRIELDQMALALGREVKGVASFRRAMRSEVRALWSGLKSPAQFIASAHSVIEREYTRAWDAGARECGIEPAEQTTAERDALNGRIDAQFPFLQGFADDIAAGSRANGGTLGPHFDRIELWVGRYDETRIAAKAMACADKKLEWVLGETEEHCTSCLKLAGKVKRASFWNDRAILPRQAGAEYLECKGFNCDCELIPTDRRVSRGPLPRLP